MQLTLTREDMYCGKMSSALLVTLLCCLAKSMECLVVTEYKLTGGIDSGLLVGNVILEKTSEMM